MRAVKGKDNRTTERRLRSGLVRAGVRDWKVRAAGLPGTPDFVFNNARVAVFADGCFWHGCRTCNPKPPHSNAAFWLAKMEMNRAKDRRHTTELKRAGWKVIRVWEHDIQHHLTRVVRKIVACTQDQE
jgi:DNA mismatch endonuclease Vsr